ncbi:MAG TPA: hypothetical protein VG146_08150 [Verrucomicrobiae bacterium]|nr:hypothetical protein [Verrucomicrobiae bacterium]
MTRGAPLNTTARIGVVLIAVGILSLALSWVKFQTQEEVFRFGNFKATATTEKTIPVLRPIGIALIGGGMLVAWLGFRQR